MALPELGIKVSEPASEVISVSPVRVTMLVKTLAPDKLRKAPADETPVPVTEMASATLMPPVNCRAAPLATVVVPAVLPKPVALLTDNVPAFTRVAPV